MFSIFKRKTKHDFDLDNPIIGKSDIYQKLKDGTMLQITSTGFKCKLCDKILWLNKSDIENGLPKEMNHCE